MRKILPVLLVVVVMILSFVAGRQFKASSAPSKSTERHVLYYVDPMHPAYKSDKPGTAPDCGMDLEPVYADSAGALATQAAIPAGTVNISYDKQQLIGVRIAEVENGTGSHKLRVVGRVTPDEERIYRISAAADGLIEKLYESSTGTRVKRDQLLATYFAPEVLNAAQSYLGWLESLGRGAAPVSLDKQVSVINRLRNLGMSEAQMKRIADTRQLPENVQIVAPADGFIVARSISVGQRFERGAELYRIADLSHVWIMADVFENEERYLRPGTVATITIPNGTKQMTAKVSHVLPQFDQSSRSLKLRLEADNGGFSLRPDMFVDIELPVSVPSGPSIPADALLDSGIKKRVFVDRGNGFFESRQVETGERFGDRVQILSGLQAGERVVVSGTFLLDSESRLKMAAEKASTASEKVEQHAAPQLKVAAAKTATVKDPRCGMDVDPEKAKAAGKTVTYKGTTYYFCSSGCKEHFEQEPEKYLAKNHAGGQHD